MIQNLKNKVVAVTPPAAIVDNAGFTTNIIDTLGFAFITVIVMLGATDIALAALKLRESDANDMTGAVDVDGADFSTDGTLPSATDDNKLYAIHVNLKGRKRYLDLTLTGGDGTTGTYASVIALLSEASNVPSSATARGFAQELIV